MPAVETIAVAWLGGRERTRPVEARRTAVPELWVHRTLDGDEQARRRGRSPADVRWTVTHRPTGGAVARFRTLREARSFCRHLADLGASWEFTDPSHATGGGRVVDVELALGKVRAEETDR